MYAESEYLISMKLSLCWEANQPCGNVYTIFDNVRLPKYSKNEVACDWDKKYLIAGKACDRKSYSFFFNIDPLYFCLFIRPYRDGPYFVIGYVGRASTQVSAQ